MSVNKYYGSMTRAESDRLHMRVAFAGGVLGGVIGAVVADNTVVGFESGGVAGFMLAAVGNNVCERLVRRFRRAAAAREDAVQVAAPEPET